MISILSKALKEVRARCMQGIVADNERCREYAQKSLGLVTALAPRIGYIRSAEVAKQALGEGKSLIEVLKSMGEFDKESIETILDPWTMTEPGIQGKTKKQKN
jgi:aspartate ammonia-lyase